MPTQPQHPTPPPSHPNPPPPPRKKKKGGKKKKYRRTHSVCRVTWHLGMLETSPICPPISWIRRLRPGVLERFAPGETLSGSCPLSWSWFRIVFLGQFLPGGLFRGQDCDLIWKGGQTIEFIKKKHTTVNMFSCPAIGFHFAFVWML